MALQINQYFGSTNIKLTGFIVLKKGKSILYLTDFYYGGKEYKIYLYF